MNTRLHHTFQTFLVRAAALLTTTVLAVGSILPTTITATAAASQGSITITPKCGDEIVSDSYNGTFTLYRVATGVETGAFDLTSHFKDYEGRTINQENLEDETTYKEIAEDLAAYVNAQTAAGNEIAPEQDELKAFTEYSLEYGLYLVMQRDKGSTYNACTPILVMIPAYSVDDDGSRNTIENVTAYPKLTKPATPGEDKPHEPPTPPTHYGKVALGKSDGETGVPLEGVVFNLYKKDKNGEWVVIGTYTTDRDGIVYVDHLSYGEYYWQEVQALDGYILDESPLDFTIQSEELRRLTMTNIPIPEESGEIHGFTGDESHMALYGAVAAAAVVGLIIWIARRRKED